MTEVTDARKKVLARIKKMLALADNNPSATEAAVAAAMASKLMDKFNIEHSEVLLAEIGEDDIIEHPTGVSWARHVPRWVARIIVATANLHDCEAKYNFSRKEGVRQIHVGVSFLGDKGDVIVAAWVFDYLLSEMKRLGLVYSKSIGGATAVQKQSFRVACAGEIAQTLHRMLRDKEREMSSHSTGQALVVCKRNLVREKFNVNYGKARRQRYGDYDAAFAGAEAGRKVSIRSGMEGSVKSPKRIR